MILKKISHYFLRDDFFSFNLFIPEKTVISITIPFEAHLYSDAVSHRNTISEKNDYCKFQQWH